MIPLAKMCKFRDAGSMWSIEESPFHGLTAIHPADTIPSASMAGSAVQVLFSSPLVRAFGLAGAAIAMPDRSPLLWVVRYDLYRREVWQA